MPNSTIIELSRAKSTKQYALNSEWSNIMNEYMTLPVGSVVQLKQAFIDEGAPFPDGAIELDEDVQISMSFIYWMTDQNKANPTYSANIAVADRGKGDLFIGCKYFNATGLGDTLEGNRLFTIPKGIYSPDNLAEFISNQMSNLDIQVSVDNVPPYTVARTNTVLQSTVDLTHIYDAYNETPGYPTAGLLLQNVKITPDLIAQFTVGKQVYIGYSDDSGKWHDYQLYTVSITLGTNAPNAFSFQPIIQYTAQGGFKVYPAAADHDFVGFYLAGDKASDKYFTFENQNTWYGASQASLIYENDRFKWNYLHSPHFIDGNGTVGISIDNTDLENTIITANSGISFTSLEPTSFWKDTLGFNLDSLVTSIDDFENYAPAHSESVMQFGVNCTGALVGNFVLPPQTLADGMAVQNAVYYSETSQTDAIIAENANGGSSNQKDPGFYYIDINGLESSKLYNEVRTDININAVVSRYRSANGLITAYSESGAQFVVQYPMKISSFDVRILLPDYTPAQTLGANSSIFIELITPTEEEQQQMKKTK